MLRPTRSRSRTRSESRSVSNKAEACNGSAGRGKRRLGSNRAGVGGRLRTFFTWNQCAFGSIFRTRWSGVHQLVLYLIAHDSNNAGTCIRGHLNGIQTICRSSREIDIPSCGDEEGHCLVRQCFNLQGQAHIDRCYCRASISIPVCMRIRLNPLP